MTHDQMCFAPPARGDDLLSVSEGEPLIKSTPRKSDLIFTIKITLR